MADSSKQVTYQVSVETEQFLEGVKKVHSALVSIETSSKSADKELKKLSQNSNSYFSKISEVANKAATALTNFKNDAALIAGVMNSGEESVSQFTDAVKQLSSASSSIKLPSLEADSTGVNEAISSLKNMIATAGQVSEKLAEVTQEAKALSESTESIGGTSPELDKLTAQLKLYEEQLKAANSQPPLDSPVSNSSSAPLDKYTAELKKLQYQLDLAKIKLEQGEHAALAFAAANRLGIDPLSKQAAQLANMQVELNNTNRKLMDCSGSARVMRNSVSNLSYQMQDIAVQSQMGTDALVIFAQQGPQIASVFGPAGAVAGAVLAFGALIGGNLIKSLFNAKASIEELEESLEKLDKTASNQSGLLAYNDKLEELNRLSEEAAQRKLISFKVDTESTLDKAVDSLNGIVSGITRVSSESLKLLEAGKSFKEVKDAATETATATYGMYRSTIKLTDSALKFYQSAGVTEKQVVSLTAALDGLRNAKTSDELVKQANAFLAVSNKIKGLKGGINNAATEIADFLKIILTAKENLALIGDTGEKVSEKLKKLAQVKGLKSLGEDLIKQAKSAGVAESAIDALSEKMASLNNQTGDKGIEEFNAQIDKMENLISVAESIAKVEKQIADLNEEIAINELVLEGSTKELAEAKVKTKDLVETAPELVKLLGELIKKNKELKEQIKEKNKADKTEDDKLSYYEKRKQALAQETAELGKNAAQIEKLRAAQEGLTIGQQKELEGLAAKKDVRAKEVKADEKNIAIKNEENKILINLIAQNKALQTALDGNVEASIVDYEMSKLRAKGIKDENGKIREQLILLAQKKAATEKKQEDDAEFADLEGDVEDIANANVYTYGDEEQALKDWLERKNTIIKEYAAKELHNKELVTEAKANLEKMYNKQVAILATAEFKRNLQATQTFINAAQVLAGAFFEDQKGLKIGLALMSTAVGIMDAFTGHEPFYVKLANAALVAATGAAQVASIRSASKDGGGGSATPPSEPAAAPEPAATQQTISLNVTGIDTDYGKMLIESINQQLALGAKIQ